MQCSGMRRSSLFFFVVVVVFFVVPEEKAGRVKEAFQYSNNLLERERERQSASERV